MVVCTVRMLIGATLPLHFFPRCYRPEINDLQASAILRRSVHRFGRANRGICRNPGRRTGEEETMDGTRILLAVVSGVCIYLAAAISGDRMFIGSVAAQTPLERGRYLVETILA